MTGDLVGRTLGDRYRFEALIGEGTFAQVYRIHDLHRRATLAAKVLRPNITREHTFFKRFEREAAILSRLQHPHIVRTYGIYDIAEQIFILMDYIPGQTLQAALLETKPLIPRVALTYLAPLVAALHFAHGEGIIHRDLKPANVMIHDNGTLYITDFGIARILNDTSTLTMGMALGTPLYMAPEQITGQPVTVAADVYALGVIAYEMLAGQTPFRGLSAGARGNSTSERIAYEHVHGVPEPPLRLNPALNEAIQAVLLRTLDKFPARRYRTVFEFYNALAEAIGAHVDLAETGAAGDLRLPEWSQYMLPVPEPEHRPDYEAPPADPPSQRTQPRHVEAVAPPAPEPVYAPPAPARPASPRRRQPGTTPMIAALILGAVAILAVVCAGSWYLLSGSDDGEPPRQPYTDVPPAVNPGAETGPTATEAESETTAQPDDLLAERGKDRIAFDSGRSGNLNIYVATLDGIRLYAVTTGSSNERGPSWSPDGTQIAFYGAEADDSNYDIYVVNADGSGLRNLTQSPDADDRYPTWSPDGAQIAFHSNADGDFDIYTLDVSSGEAQQITDNTAEDLGPDWSPDGQHIAFHTDQWGTPYQIAVIDLAARDVRQLTRSDSVSSFPAWSPDGAQIAFNVLGESQGVNLYVMQADGSGMHALTDDTERDAFPDWSPDGAYLIYQHGPENASSIRAIPLIGGDPIPLTGDESNFLPEWAPESG